MKKTTKTVKKTTKTAKKPAKIPKPIITKKPTLVGSKWTAHYVKYLSVPNNVTDDVKNTNKIDTFDVSGVRVYNERILRCKKIVFHPLGILNWEFWEYVVDENFIVISADEIVINAPASDDKIAILNLVTPYHKPPYNGSYPHGNQGRTGLNGETPYSYHPLGRPGTDGGDGGDGEKGQTHPYPFVYIFYKSITVNFPNPNIHSGLRILGNGLNGGNGGKGGTGGNGGQGEQGTSGSNDWIICTAGPGKGGTGGTAGKGGKGGDGGDGGNGASIFVIGSENFFDKINSIEFNLNKGNPGKIGLKGSPGTPGGGGPKGWKPDLICSDASNGDAGRNPTPLDFGPGNPGSPGQDGNIFEIVRDNSDL